MPDSQRIVIRGGMPAEKSKGNFITSSYNTLTSAENAPIARSIAMFAVAVTFLSSSWAEILLPPQ